MPEECGHPNGACYPGHCDVEAKERKERNAATLSPLTEQQWTRIRIAAKTWVEQVDKAMPGPQPLLGVIQQVIAETPLPEPERLSLMGDVIVAEVNECTCGSGGPYPHEPYCGVEPYLWLNKIGNADLTVEYGVRIPHTDGFDIYEDEEEAKAVARARKAIVYPRYVLRGRF